MCLKRTEKLEIVSSVDEFSSGLTDILINTDLLNDIELEVDKKADSIKLSIVPRYGRRTRYSMNATITFTNTATFVTFTHGLLNHVLLFLFFPSYAFIFFKEIGKLLNGTKVVHPEGMILLVFSSIVLYITYALGKSESISAYEKIITTALSNRGKHK